MFIPVWDLPRYTLGVRHIPRYVACFLCLASLIGCGGSGLDSRDVRVKPDVVVLPSGATISELTPTSLRLSGYDGPLAVGNVLVSGEGDGALRRITAIDRQPDFIALTTEAAGLTDVFERATASFSQDLGAADIVSIDNVPDGVEILPPGRAEGEWTLTLRGMPLSAGGSGAVVGTVDGSIRFSVRVDFQKIIRDGNIRLIRIVPSYSVRPSVTLRLTGGRGAVNLGEIKFRRTVPVGGVPVVLTFIVKLETKASVETNGLIELTAAITGTNGFGFMYQNGTLSPVVASGFSDTKLSFQVPEQSSVTLNYGAFSPDLEVRLYEAVGAFVTADIPNVPITYQRVSTPADGARLTVDGVLQGTAGLRLSAWELGSADIGLPYAELFKSNLIDRFFPDSGRIDITID